MHVLTNVFNITLYELTFWHDIWNCKLLHQTTLLCKYTFIISLNNSLLQIIFLSFYIFALSIWWATTWPDQWSWTIGRTQYLSPGPCNRIWIEEPDVSPTSQYSYRFSIVHTTKLENLLLVLFLLSNELNFINCKSGTPDLLERHPSGEFPSHWTS